MEGRHTLGCRSMVDVMHLLLLPPYLLHPKSCKGGIKKTTLLQTDLFVEDRDVEKSPGNVWTKMPVLQDLLPGESVWYEIILSFCAQRKKS